MHALLALPEALYPQMFRPDQRAELEGLLSIEGGPTTDLSSVPDAVLSRVEVLVTGWGSPQIGAEALARMPRLLAIVHTAGSTRSVASQAVWEAGNILVTSATAANAVPVAEFALAQILLAGKRSLRREADLRTHGRGHRSAVVGGNYGAVIGLIGASHIGRLVAGHLRPFDVQVLIADPYVDAAEIAALGARKVELEELFAASDVVSLHAPDVPSTTGLVSAELLASMPDGATFLNTARPALVDEDALRAEVLSGRIAAVLDVHDQLTREDLIWEAEAVSITPHIAGSQGNELFRLGESALEEVRRLVRGDGPAHPVDPARREISA